jgi:hypothetical protein
MIIVVIFRWIYILRECLSLKEYISSNINQFKNKIIICDRAYYCYDFFNFLIENDIKFIIRLRDKASKKEPSKHSKHYEAHNDVFNNKNVRLVEKVFITKKSAVKDSTSIDEIEESIMVKLITNLNSKNYDNDKILDLYSSRWNIEEYFKQHKHNFKFQNFTEHHEDSYKKNIYASLTIAIIKQILIKCFETVKEITNKTIISKNNNEIKIKKMINENLVLAGIKDFLLREMIYNKIDKNKLNIFLNSYFVFTYNKEGRHFERKSKRPFTKWYVKQYHYVYKIKQKMLKEDIKIYLKDGDTKHVKELKERKKDLNKEFKKLKEEFKKEINEKNQGLNQPITKF